MTRDKDHIRAVESAREERPGGQVLPPLVVQIRDNSLTILLSYLDQLFASCDDLFFDLSSRAANNNEQNLYFESMRELRIKKNGIITQYRHLVEQLFKDCAGGIRPAGKAASPAARDDALSLVQHDEIEQDVAINSMISKARVNNQEALYQLQVRLDYLIPQATIDHGNNPLDPEQLCRSFASACDLLDINIKAKIILYKQFERLVVSRLANVYSNANDFLINAGIIPRVSRHVARSRSATAPSQQADTGAEQAEKSEAYQASPIQFDELSNLLSTLRSLGSGTIPSYQVYSANPGPRMTNYELLAAITLLQQQFASESNDLYIHRLIGEVLTQSNPETPNSVEQTDEDTINLVAMFFDFVLGDNTLPTAIQAQISRLQIPILKVALKDRSFFNNSNHPARKLVNRLAEISIGLDEAVKDDDTFELVASIVQQIHENYAVDSGVFAAKLEQLEQFAARSARRSDLIEKRTNQAEAGKAKTELAKSTTQSLLLEKLSSQHLPSSIFDFLVEQWQQLLTLVHIKYGEDSTQWIDSVQLVQDLTWACQPLQDTRSRERLEKIKGQLIDRVRNGLKAITLTDDQADEISARIEQAIERCQSGEKGLYRQPMSHEHARALGHTPGAGTKSWKEMSALERQQSRHSKLTYEYIKKAEELPLNSWFSYEDINTGQTQRCKLSARIDTSDTYVFVNRLGFKVLKKSRKDFAYDMQKGWARPLHTEPLFDRAMARIRNRLAPTGSTTGPA